MNTIAKSLIVIGTGIEALGLASGPSAVANTLRVPAAEICSEASSAVEVVPANSAQIATIQACGNIVTKSYNGLSQPNAVKATEPYLAADAIIANCPNPVELRRRSQITPNCYTSLMTYLASTDGVSRTNNQRKVAFQKSAGLKDQSGAMGVETAKAIIYQSTAGNYGKK
jgi:hypothetical protein